MAGEEGAYYGYFLGMSALALCINFFKIFDFCLVKFSLYAYTGFVHLHSDDNLSLQSRLESVKTEEIPENIAFVQAIIQAKSFFGSYPGHFPEGFVLCGHRFPPGYFEDFFFFFFNNNFIISMVSATKGLYYSRFMRITNHFASTTLAFYVFVIVSSMNAAGTDKTAVTIVQVFVLSPFILIVNILLKFSFACSLCPTQCQENKKCCRWQNPLFLLFVLSLWTGGVLWILLAAFTTRSSSLNYKKELASYVYSSQVIAIASDLVNHFATMGMGHSNYKFFICGIRVYEIGTWYDEYCEAAHVPETSYVIKDFPFCCGCFKMQSKVAVTGTTATSPDQKIKQVDMGASCVCASCTHTEQQERRE